MHAIAVRYTADDMTRIGGNRWQKAGHDRVYLDWAEFAPIEITRYKTGNLSGAAWKGDGISNRQAHKLLASLRSVYYDVHTGCLVCEYGRDDCRVADQEEIWEAVIDGIHAAVAALNA